MSSHREAPAISTDPVADNTDLYAFVSPDKPNTVTLVANYVPLEGPDGGPNFFQFGDDVLYQIHIDNDGDAIPDISYQFRFHTELRNPNTFLYNTGQILTIDSPNWNRRQFYSVTRVTHDEESQLGAELPCPPCNIGPRSTPGYAALAQAAIMALPSGETVFAGQRAEGFYVDLGSIFDLLDLRPFENLHLIPTPAAPGVNGTNKLNVHTIAIQVPMNLLTQNGSTPTDATLSSSVIGVWASASRPAVRLRHDGEGDDSGEDREVGPWIQVSRLGNPLFNEVIVPLGNKDRWNALPPYRDAEFLQYVQHPEVAGLLPVLYPGVFPNLAGLAAARADLVAILLTGIPSGIIKGFQNFTGSTPADMLRLNMAIPPATSPNIYGLLGGDVAGYPNGRRVQDDTVAIELRAIAGVTYPLVDPTHTFTPDGAASLVTDGLTPASVNAPYLASFPYLGIPYDGFDNPAS